MMPRLFSVILLLAAFAINGAATVRERGLACSS